MTLEDVLNTKFLSSLVEKFRQNGVVVFCGAGISYDSGVPLVNDIKIQILKDLGVSNDDITQVLNTKIPFELFMQTMIEHSGSEVLFDLFSIGEPNANHYLLARLAKQKFLKIIVTTNFDDLIESALRYENVSYDVFYKGTDFLQIDWESDSLKLIKLHGSIHDKKNIAVTIKRVAEKRLYSYRKLIISKILDNSIGDSLLVMGYSCSDYFDVNPIIEEINNTHTKIFFLNHCSDDLNLIETPLSEIVGKNPFKKCPGIVVNAFTNFVTESLRKDLVQDSSSDALSFTTTTTIWQKVIKEWINDARFTNGNGINEYLSGQIFNVCTKYGMAINYFKSSMSFAKENLNHYLLIDCLYALGRCYRDTQRTAGATQLALRLLFHALKLGIKYRSAKKQMHCMLSLGVTLEDKKEHYKAIYYYEDALRFARKLMEKEVQAICLGDIAIVFKNMAGEDKRNAKYLLPKAFKYQSKALELSIEIGDKGSEGRTYGNMGIILSCQGDSEGAISYYEQAYRIASELDDAKHQGIWKYNKGFDLISSDPASAIKEIKTAKAIFSDIDPPLENYISLCDKNIELLEKLISPNPFQ